MALLGAWGAALKTLSDFPKNISAAKRTGLLKEAQLLRTTIVKGIADQEPGGKKFKPLSPKTIAIRKFMGFKGTKALIRRGDLRNGIVVHEDGDGSVFVGIMRKAKAKDGQPLVDVAKLNEYGSRPIVIKITPKMAAFLHAAFRKAGGEFNRMGPPKPSTGIIVIRIPARPFLGPSYEALFKDSQVASARYAEHVAKSLQGKGLWTAIGRAL